MEKHSIANIISGIRILCSNVHPDKLEFVTLLCIDTHPEFEYTHEYVRR